LTENKEIEHLDTEAWANYNISKKLTFNGLS